MDSIVLHSPLNFTVSYGRVIFRFMLFIIASASIFYSFIGQSSTSPRTLWVIDTSLSMVTQDIGANNNTFISRFDAAKKIAISGMLASHTENALLTFDSTARLQLPFSEDVSTFSSVVNGLEVVAYGEGTDMSVPLSSIALIYPHEAMHIILLTDGENSGTGGIYPDLPAGTDLSVVGVGTAEGGPMLQGYDADGNRRYKQYQGSDAISRLDTAALDAIAKRYHGNLFTVANIRDIGGVVDRIVKNGQLFQKTSSNWLLYSGILLFFLALLLKPYKMRKV